MARVIDGLEGDQRIDLLGRLLSFEFLDDSKKADKCTFVLNNFDLAYLDDSIWQQGQKIEVSWGYEGRLHVPQEAIIKRVYGGRTLTVEAFAKSVELNKEQKTRSWHNVKRSDVARQIAQEHGYYSDRLFVQGTTEVLETVNQAAETDAWLLSRLAKREGFNFFVDNSGFHFGDPDLESAPSHVLTYYTDPGQGDILDFSFEGDLFNSPGKVEVKGSSAEKKSQLDQTGSDRDTKRTELADEIEIVDPATGETTIQRRMQSQSIRHSSAQTEQAAKREADARFKRAARNRIRLKLDCVGDPTLTAKRVIEVRGLGAYLSGKYYIESARHKIENGYVTMIVCKRGTVGRVPGGKGKETEAAKNRQTAQTGSGLFEKVDETTGEISYQRGR